MKADKASRDRVDIGSIVQVSPEFDHPEFRMQIGVVIAIESWGVRLHSSTPIPLWSDLNVTWAFIEPTGGKVVFDQIGERLRETDLPQSHHP